MAGHKQASSGFIVPFLIAVLLLGVGFMGFRAGSTSGSDFARWYQASKQWQSGSNVYSSRVVKGEMPHGPVFLMMLTPFTWFDIKWAQRLWVVGSMVLLLHGVHLLSKMLEYEAHVLGPAVASHAPWLALLLIGPFLYDFFQHRGTGIFVLWWMLLGISLLGRRCDARAGFCLAVAAAISVLPITLLPWLLYKKRLAAVAAFAVAFVAVSTLPMLWPSQGYKRTSSQQRAYITLVKRDMTTESTDRAQQSLKPLVFGSISRNLMGTRQLFRSRRWIVRGLVVFLILLCMFWIHSGHGSRGMPRPANSILIGETSLVLGTATLLSPLAPMHYYLWLYPAATFMMCSALGGAKRNRARSWSALLAFTLLVTLPHRWAIGHVMPEFAQSWHRHHGFAAGLLLTVILMGWTLRGEWMLRAMKGSRG